MKFSASAFQAAVALHLSPQLATRVGQLYEEARAMGEPLYVQEAEGDGPADGISITDAADLLALALHGGALLGAIVDLRRMTLSKATLHLDSYGVSTLSPSDIQYEPVLSDWVEDTFAHALMGPMWAGITGPCPVGNSRPYWTLLEIYSHDDRILGGHVGMQFNEGAVCLSYGEEPPATRMVTRRSISGDGLYFVGNAIRESSDVDWPAELAALSAAAAAASPSPSSGDHDPTVH